MSATAKDAILTALRLCGHVNPAGAVDQNRMARYFGAAPAYLTLLTREIAAAENSGAQMEPVEDENSVLAVSDDSAARVLPFGLAMYFSLLDHDGAFTDFFSGLYYGRLLPSVRAEETDIADHYGVLCDPTLLRP